MAESMVQSASSGKAKEKTVRKPNMNDSKNVPPKEQEKRNPSPLSGQSTSGHTDPKTVANAQSQSANVQNELLKILTDIRANQKSHETQLSSIQSRIVSLEQTSYEAETGGQDEYGQYIEYEDGEYYEAEHVPMVNEGPFSQPPNTPQIPSDNTSQSVFKDLGSKYNAQEILDCEVDDNLAAMTNAVFKEGLQEEKFRTLTTETGRPSNCDALVKTRVNHMIWNLLSTEMHYNDGKMQTLQDGVVKAATVVVKLLNLASDRLSRAEIEMGTDAIGLLGHSNKLINDQRKAMHRKELNQEYHHLCSRDRGFTDLLYGDDVGKDVKEIQDINRIGTKIKSSYSGQSYQRGRGRGAFRGVFRGRVTRPRGRGRGGFRSKNPRGVYNHQK